MNESMCRDCKTETPTIGVWCRECFYRIRDWEESAQSFCKGLTLEDFDSLPEGGAVDLLNKLSPTHAQELLGLCELWELPTGNGDYHRGYQAGQESAAKELRAFVEKWQGEG